MRASSQLLLTFLLNAVWQIALIAALASLGAWLLRRSAMRYQHWLWVGALGLSLLVPAVTALFDLGTNGFSTTEPTFERQLTNPVLTRGVLPFQSPSTESVSNWSFQLNPTLALILLLVYAALLLFRVFRLIQAWFATRKVRQAAVLWERDDAVAAITRECAKRIKLDPDRVATVRDKGRVHQASPPTLDPVSSSPWRLEGETRERSSSSE